VAGDSALGSATVSMRGGAVAAGIDYQIDPNFLLGAAGGVGPSSFSVPDRETSGTVSTSHAALYGSTRWGSLYTAGILSFDMFRVQTDRFAFVPGVAAPVNPLPDISEKLQGDFSARSLSGRFETGYKFIANPINVTPLVAAAQFSSLRMDGFTENALISTNTGNLALNSAGQTVGSLRTFLGTQLDSKFFVGGNSFEPWLRASWVHEFDRERSLLAAFSAAPGFYFPIDGARSVANSARINAGLKVGITPGIAIFANFDGDFSSKSDTLAGMGGFKISW
jgi:outer membrane autotransporter protein